MFLVTLIVLILIILYLIKPNLEHYSSLENASWSRNKCKYKLTENITKTFDRNNIKYVKQGDILLPCNYNNTQAEINKLLKSITKKSRDKRIFIIDKADQISNKQKLWINLREKYGLESAAQLMPMTYDLLDTNDMERFKQEFDPKTIYIMKKNIQRQHGLKVTNNPQLILDSHHDGYVVVQKMLQNPYLVRKRKINLRVYLLVVCHGDSVEGYIHENGFMYYTPQSFKKNSQEIDRIITTGYIDRKVYEENPLTLKDFRAYLDDSGRQKTRNERTLSKDSPSLSRILDERIQKLANQVIGAIKDKVCINHEMKNHVCFQLYGMDVAVSDNLVPMLMEINKGPDLGSKDDRDGNVKLQLVQDIFTIVKAVKHAGHSFIRVH